MENNCCPTNNKKGVISGLLYGLLPHSFCIGFILFSVIGAASAAAIFRQFLLFPYFFQFLVIFSFLMATLSAVIYLKKMKCFCKEGIKSKWKYLTILYSATILTNLLMFFVIFPAIANSNSKNVENSTASLFLSVQIPCSGHAPLITDELKKDPGVGSIKFKLPNVFEISYNPEKTSPAKILSLDIFQTFKATSI